MRLRLRPATSGKPATSEKPSLSWLPRHPPPRALPLPPHPPTSPEELQCSPYYRALLNFELRVAFSAVRGIKADISSPSTAITREAEVCGARCRYRLPSATEKGLWGRMRCLHRLLYCLRDGCEGTSCPHCKPHAANHAAYITSTPHSRAHMRGPDEDKSGGGGEVGEVRGPVAMYLLKRGGFGGWVGESQRGLPCSS